MRALFKTLLLSLVLGIVFLTGCATTVIEEEGGISGTGNNINCDEEKYRKHKLCKP